MPLDNRPLNAILNPRPRRRGARHRYVYKPFGAPVPEPSAVHVPNREHTITAEVEIGGDAVAEGILLAMGSALGGFSLYLRDGRLRYVHNLYAKERHVVSSDEVIAPGAHELAFSFKKTKGFAGTGTLRVDGRVVGEGEIPHFTPMAFTATGGGLTCGYEVGPAVGDDYVAPFRCNAVDSPGHRRGVGRARTRSDGGLPGHHGGTMNTIAELVRARAGDPRVGLRFEDSSWTYAELLDCCAERAAFLLARRPAGRPFHVGVLLDNVPEFWMLLGAAALSGATLVGINPTRRGAELARDVQHTDCALLITESTHLDLLEGAGEVVPPDSLFVVDTPGWDTALAPHAGAALPDVEISPADVFMLIFTSGTTGAPKAVRMSHGKLAAWGSNLAGRFPLTPDDDLARTVASEELRSDRGSDGCHTERRPLHEADEPIAAGDQEEVQHDVLGTRWSLHLLRDVRCEGRDRAVLHPVHHPRQVVAHRVPGVGWGGERRDPHQDEDNRRREHDCEVSVEVR